LLIIFQNWKCYLLENKTKESILLYLKKFFEFYGPPQQFGCDNGREFVNNLFENYLESKYIKIAHVAPYAQKSQGIVECIHVTVGNALISKYLENIESFNIELELPIIMNQYNNIIHRITGYTPYEVFYFNNKVLWNEVYNNTLNNYNKSKSNFITYNINEEVLLINNIIKTKNKNKEDYQILAINKIKKKKNFNKICVVIK